MDDPFTLELSENIHKYNETVLQPFWKKNRFRMAGGMYAPNKRCEYFDAETFITSELLNGTPLEYDGQNHFLHYTSLQGLISILKSRRIRLYDFNNFNDPTEFIYANRYFQNFSDDKELREYKRQFFALSLCDYSDELVNNNINLWRLYADNGKGACITFEVEQDNISKLHDFAFGRIKYNPTPERIKELEEILERDAKFQKENNFRCNNLPDLIAPLCCFYKSDLFKIENEVRLFHFSKRRLFDRHESDAIQCELNRDGKKVYFIELPIDKEEDASIPLLKIKAVHLGYNISADTRYEVSDTIGELKFPYSFDLGITPVSRHFQ